MAAIRVCKEEARKRLRRGGTEEHGLVNNTSYANRHLRHEKTESTFALTLRATESTCPEALYTILLSTKAKQRRLLTSSVSGEICLEQLLPRSNWYNQGIFVGPVKDLRI